MLRTTSAYVYVLATYGTETPFKIHTPTKFTPQVSRRVNSDRALTFCATTEHRPNFQIAESELACLLFVTARRAVRALWSLIQVRRA